MGPPPRTAADGKAGKKGEPVHSRFGGWRAKLLLAAAATVGAVAVLGAVGEWAVRHRERSRSTVPGTMSMLFYRHRD